MAQNFARNWLALLSGTNVQSPALNNDKDPYEVKCHIRAQCAPPPHPFFIVIQWVFDNNEWVNASMKFSGQEATFDGVQVSFPPWQIYAKFANYNTPICFNLPCSKMITFAFFIISYLSKLIWWDFRSHGKYMRKLFIEKNTIFSILYSTMWCPILPCYH